MSAAVSTSQRLFCQLEEIDILLKELLEKISRNARFDTVEHIVLSLLEKDKERKKTLEIVSKQMETQIKIEKLRLDCGNSDLQISACRNNLKKCELLLSTALYYSRQKLDSVVKAVENPTDVDDLIKVAHRISCSYGALAPDNWTPNDPRRPYPNKEEIRRGYLGHLDDSGKFLSTLWDVVAQIHPSGNFASVSALPTPGAANATPTQPILCSSGQTPNLSSILPESLDGAGSGRHIDSGITESPSPRMQWQQHRVHQGFPAVHLSTQPQPRKRTHLGEYQRYSDASSDDDTRLVDFPPQGY